MIDITGERHFNIRPFFCFDFHISDHEPGGDYSLRPVLHYFILIMNGKLTRERSLRNIKQKLLKSFRLKDLRVINFLTGFKLQFSLVGTFKKAGRVECSCFAPPTVLNSINLFRHCKNLHCKLTPGYSEQKTSGTTKKGWSGCFMERPGRFFYRPPRRCHLGA